MAAPRRNVLNGASDWQREEKLNQQRDYAAQLQEQVRLKNAAAEHAKAQKLHEQRLEREMVDRERAANTKQRFPQQQQQQQQQQLSPSKSPTRAASFPTAEPEMHHATKGLGGSNSPVKTQWPAGPHVPGQHQPFSSMPHMTDQQHTTEPQPHHFGQPQSFSTANNNNNTGSPTKFGHYQALQQPPAAATYSFSNTPSIFESLLRETEQAIAATQSSGGTFDDALVVLQQLGNDIERTWQTRRVAAHHTYVKPNFLLSPDDVHAATAAAAQANAAASPVSPIRSRSESPMRRSEGGSSPLKTLLSRSAIGFELPTIDRESDSDSDEFELGLANDASNQDVEIGGLSGESVLIPIAQALAVESPERISTSSSSLRSPTLRHDSELQAFTSHIG